MPFVQQRRGTKAALQAANEIPLDGQIVIEDQPEGGFRLKVGDGTTNYSNLNYWTASLSELADVADMQGPAADDGKVLVRGANGLFYENNVPQAQMGSPPLGGYPAGTLGAELASKLSAIPDGAVSTAKLADDAVTAAKIAADAVTSSEIAANAVTNTEIAANTILTGNIAPQAVNTQSITDDAVTYAKIQNVGAGKILGNEQGSAGSVEEITTTTFGRSLLNVADAAALATTLGAATTSDITTAINNLIDSAPGALDTLNELAAAINDDASFSTTVTNSMATKMPLAGGTFTGDVGFSRDATNKRKIDFGAQGPGFSTNATDFDYIRLYTSGSTYAGFGITTSNMNVGTKGLINLKLYANNDMAVQYASSGITRHYWDQFFNQEIYVAQGNTPGAPKISVEGDSDTGIYFPAADNVAFAVNGKRKIDVTENVILVDRKGGNPTLKASATGVDGSAGGWMIIDSVTNPCSLNYYSGADVQLAYGGGGATVGTVAQGTYKFRVHGGQSHFSNAITVAADAVYAPVYRSSIDGTVGAAAYGRENDGNTGMFFPAADKVALTAGGTEMFRAESGAIEVTQQFRIPDGTNALPGLVFGSDTNTGIYKVGSDRIGVVTGGAARFQIDSNGAAAFNTAPISGTSHYSVYNSVSRTEKTSLQGSVNSVTHTVTNGSAAYATIGVNGSAYKTITTDNVTENGSSYVRGGHFAASTRTQTGCTSAQTIGVYSVAQHLNSTAGSTQLVGGQFLCYQSSPGSTAVGAYGVFARCSITSAADSSSVITNAYALYSDVTKSTGTITNGYGLLIGDINATNKYGVYVNDVDATNIFLGPSQFGNTTGSSGSFKPGITFNNDPDSGLGKNASTANVVDLISGGNIVGTFGPTGLRVIDGTTSDPSIAFSSDTDTGINLTSSNLNLVHSGANKISVGSGGSTLGGTVTFSGNISDGTTTKTASEVIDVPSSYGQNLLFG